MDNGHASLADFAKDAVTISDELPAHGWVVSRETLAKKIEYLLGVIGKFSGILKFVLGRPV
jgi:hypothetical protein